MSKIYAMDFILADQDVVTDSKTIASGVVCLDVI